MLDISTMVITPETPVLEAMSVIDKNARGIAFVCRDGILEGTLTDGDIRRYILRKGDLSAPAAPIANRNFRRVAVGQSPLEIQELFAKWSLDCIPVVAKDGRLVDVAFLHSKEKPVTARLGVPVVIMAGGKGTRLYPYTKVLPKPLIPIGDLTITEHIMRRFIEYGCTEFSMIVNHKRNMIKAYFADEDLDYNVSFVEETVPLGTGGGLGLLRGRLDGTFFLTNCDIMVFEDFAKILEYHKSTGNLLTMVCTTKKVTIPYGTVEINNDGKIVSMVEKPSFSFLTNTGFYVIEPRFLDDIVPGTFVHITDLIQVAIDKGEPVGIFPVSADRWSDMGQHEEMEKMKEKMGY